MTTPDARADYAYGSALLARLQGHLAEAAHLDHEWAENARQAGILNPELLESVNLAYDDAWFRGNATGAVRRLDELFARTPMRTVRMSEAPYLEAVLAYAAADRPDRARTLLEEWNVRRKESPTTRDTVTIHRMRGAIALAAKDYATAQSELRFTETQGCVVCDLPRLGRSFDLAGAPDSAIAVYERYLTTLWPDRLELDARFLPAVEQRLGELYEAKGQQEKALAHYRRFVELWKTADPELQPRVTDAKLRVTRLTKGADSR
jgi:tetratricopeptide (TPR) repeat protein